MLSALLFAWVAAAPASATNEVTAPKPVAADSAQPYDNPTNGLGCWIWTTETRDWQTCQFWRSFEVPASAAVTRARLRMTADNEFTLFLDGRELGRGVEWRELFDFNLTPLVTPGRHVLAIKTFNAATSAGMILGLRIDLADGRTIEIKSDQDWRIVPNDTTKWERKTRPSPDWPAATIIAPLGTPPWWSKPDNVNAMPTLQPIEVHFWQTGWFQIALLTLFGLVILVSLRLMAQLALHRKERWLLQQERARIARDIHDDVGSRMTQLVLHGEVAQSELPADSTLRPQLDRICQEAREVLSTVDEILWALNPRRDTLHEFASYVCSYAEDFLKPTAIQGLFEIDPEMTAGALDLPVRRSLLMAIKEALNNAVKYSHATELRLQIQRHNGKLRVVVQDNGLGFDPATATRGHGLDNMVQRMKELGGNCAVASQPAQGCRIEFEVPLAPPRRLRWGWLRTSAVSIHNTTTDEPRVANPKS